MGKRRLSLSIQLLRTTRIPVRFCTPVGAETITYIPNAIAGQVHWHSIRIGNATSRSVIFNS
jgi:hypothetical protein